MGKEGKADNIVEDDAEVEEEEERIDDDSEEEYGEEGLENNNNNHKEILDTLSSDSSSFVIRFGAKLPLFIRLYVNLIYRSISSDQHRNIAEDCTIEENIRKLFETLSVGARSLETGASIAVQPTRNYEPFSDASVQNFMKRAKVQKHIFWRNSGQ